MSRVHVVKTTYVPLPPSPAPLPDRVDLSLFDALWICFPPIQRLLLFRGSHVPPLPALLDSLRPALSRTLLHYFTLAGKLTYAPASGDVFIDCSPAAIGPGVAFFEAECEGGDLGRLADDEVHDVDAFVQLIPELDATELPAPVFAVQVTRFRGAEGSADQGVALGFAAHHSVVDGRALWRFVEAWAAECRGEAGPPPPSLDRSVIKHPKGKEIARMFLHRMSPCLPKTTPFFGAIERLSPEFERRTFVMSRDQIQLLKQQTTQSVNAVVSKQLQAGRSTTLRPPSTFISISAHAWIAFVRSKGFQPDAEAYIIVIADCRPRLDPPVDDAFFGNCVKYFCAKTRASELLGEEGPARACAALQNAINEALEDPLKDCETWLNVFDEIDMSRLVNLTASPRFMVYDITDFGWGRPSRAELVSMNNDGQVVFVGARDGEGVQVSLALHSLHMEAFAKHFSGN